MTKYKFRTKDGIEAQLPVPGARYHVLPCVDGTERTYRMEAYHATDGAREYIYVENCESRPVLIDCGPAEVVKERDKLRRELENLKRKSEMTLGDWGAMNKRLGAERDKLLVQNAWLEKELGRERAKNRKRGI